MILAPHDSTHVYGPEHLTLDLFTEREGVLSRAGHDLHLRAEQLTARREGGLVHVEIVAGSVEPICARIGDRDAFGLLSDADLKRIRSNLHGEILQVRRFPWIRATIAPPTEPGQRHCEAEVELCGRRGRVRLFLERRADRVLAHAEVVQTAFGIEPYTTMFGAIRVKDTIALQASAPTALLSP